MFCERTGRTIGQTFFSRRLLFRLPFFFALAETLPASLSMSSSSLLCSKCGSNANAVRTYGTCGTPSLPPWSLSGRSSSSKGEMAETPKK